MSNIDRKYIDALDIFTSALEEIVETLKSQKKTADPVNQFLKTPMGDLSQVVNELKSITEKGFTDLKSQNETIIKKIESIKQQKESGMFGNIEDPKNKNKIVDGIKVVMLIAGGVLALGLAFKIIGKVDFLSVMALSGAVLIMSVAFSKISDQKLKFAEVFKIALALPIMAVSLAISGMMLKGFPTFTIAQGLSILIIGGALGIASVLLLKSLNSISLKSLLLIPLLPFILPLIAMSLVGASIILKGIQKLTMSQVFAVATTGIAIGIALASITFSLKFMKNTTIGQLLLVAVAIPIISFMLVKASEILSNIKHIKDPMRLIKDSFSIGLSILAFAPAVFILGKMKLTDIVQGILGLYFLSDAIVSVASKFEKLPNKMRYPDFMWSLGVGISLLVFIPTVYILGKMKFEDIVQGILGIYFLSSAIVSVASKFEKLPAKMRYPDFMWSLGVGLSLLVFTPVLWLMGKMSLESVLLGVISLPFIAYAIVLTSNIFNKLSNEMKYPSLEWTLGAGLSVLAFGAMAAGLGVLFTATGGLAALGMAGALLAILAVAYTIVGTAAILNTGNYKNYPSLDWAEGVGLSLIAFSLASVLALGAGAATFVGKLFSGGKDPLLMLAQRMNDVAYKLNEVNWSSVKYPSKAYAEGVGGLLNSFANVFAKISAIEGFNKIITSLFGGSNSDNFTTFIMNAAGAMIIARNILNKGGNWSNASYPSKDYAEGVGGMLESLANSFAAISAISGLNRIVSALFGGGTEDFNTFVINAVATMVVARDALSKGGDWSNEKNYPSKDYAEGVGGMLLAMAEVYQKINSKGLTSLISKNISLSSFVKEASQAMVDSSKILAGVKFDSLDKIIPMLKSLSELKPMDSDVATNYIDFLNNMKDAPELKAIDAKTNSIFKLANSFLTLANSLTLVNKNLSGFGNLSKGLFLISIIDDKKFNNVLESVDKYKNTLQLVNQIPEDQVNLLGVIKGLYETGTNKETTDKVPTTQQNAETAKQTQFYNDISDIRNLLYDMKDTLIQPSDTGSFHK